MGKYKKLLFSMEMHMKNLLVIIALLVTFSFSLTQIYAQDQGITTITIGKTALDVQISGGKYTSQIQKRG